MIAASCASEACSALSAIRQVTITAIAIAQCSTMAPVE
jgi:hypothetical protein